MIQPSDITIIIQGPYHNVYTPQAIKSVKKLLPLSRVILSTWEGSKIGDDCPAVDMTLYNKDPKSDMFGNVNRQLCSTLAGLDQVNTEYVLKMRSDFVLTNLNMLSFAQADAPRKYPIFKRRIIAYVWRPQNIFKKNKRLFHPGDFYYFGRTEDVKNLLQEPLAPAKSDFTKDKTLSKLSAEQYIWRSFLKKINFKNFSPEDIFESSKKDFFNRVLADNFIFLNYYEFGTRTLKSALKKNNIACSNSAFNFEDWLRISGCRLPRTNFPSTKIPFSKRAKIHSILLRARILQLFYINKQKREKARADVYDRINAEDI